jgi:hypothetical protein
MPKIRTDKWKRKTFNISEEAIEKLKMGCFFTKLNESEFIEYLIIQWSEPLNPLDKIEKITSQIDQLKGEITKLEKEEKIAREHLRHIEKWKKEKLSKKPQAIAILKRKILDKEYQEVERIAKTWAVILGEYPLSLIAEAQEDIDKKGI